MFVKQLLLIRVSWLSLTVSQEIAINHPLMVILGKPDIMNADACSELVIFMLILDGAWHCTMTTYVRTIEISAKCFCLHS